MRFHKHLRMRALRGRCRAENVRVAIVILFIVVTEAVTDRHVWADSRSSSEHAAVAESSGPPETSKQTRFNGFAKFRKGFQAICEQVYLDGRGERLSALLKAGPIDSENCEACRSLFSDFALACRPPKSKITPKSKKDESVPPTATPLYRQRDPSTKTIEYSLGVFRALAERPESKLISQAVTQLLQRLSERGDKSPAEYDYFMTLVSYMRAPFAEAESSSAPSQVAPRPTVDVEALFD